MIKRWQHFVSNPGRDRGASMVEYGLLVSLIAIVLIAAVVFFSDGLYLVFDKAGNSMSTAAGG